MTTPCYDREKHIVVSSLLRLLQGRKQAYVFLDNRDNKRDAGGWRLDEDNGIKWGAAEVYTSRRNEEGRREEIGGEEERDEVEGNSDRKARRYIEWFSQ